MTVDADRMLAVLRAMPGAGVLTEGGVIVAANAEAVEATGVAQSRLVGALLADLVLAEHQRRVLKLLAGSGPDLTRAEVRLAAGLRPVELVARRLTPRVALVTVRSMEREMELSAAAGGALTHDPVTGLPNRYYVLEELYQRLRSPAARPLSCVAVWVDDINRVIAERGPRAAERILSQVGERIHGRLRAPDLLGRYDDRGFLVLMASDMDSEQLERVAVRLRDEIGFPVEHENALLAFTASMALVPLAGRRPALQAVIGRLDETARRAAGGGNVLEVIQL